MYKTINGSWTPVESKYSDITGKTQFYYMALVNYKFYLSKTGYDDKVFNLNPVLFSEYDIKMEATTLINYSQDFDNLAIIFSPLSFDNNNCTTFYFMISSPSGLLTEYGYNLTYPSDSNSSSGVNAIGEQLTSTICISALLPSEVVTLDYYYITSLSNRRNFTYVMPINWGDYNNTFIMNKTNDYGLGIFERILIVTLILIFVMGISTLVGQPIPGFVITLFVAGYMVYIGFIPIWIILPSMMLGFFVVVWRSGG
jgi:hypothetical protein